MSYYPKAETKFDKRNAQILHAIRRARERYGLELSIADIESLAKIIRTQTTKKVKALSNSRTVHELTYQGITVLVIYDKKRHTLVTFLPRSDYG